MTKLVEVKPDRTWQTTEEGQALLERYYDYYRLAVPANASYRNEEIYLKVIALILLDHHQPKENK